MLKAYTLQEWKSHFPIKQFGADPGSGTTEGPNLVSVRRASTPVNIRMSASGEAETHYVDAGYFEIVVAANAYEYPDRGSGREEGVADYTHIRSLPIAIQRAIAYVEANQPKAEALARAGATEPVTAAVTAS
jgi:hypothetical protein